MDNERYIFELRERGSSECIQFTVFSDGADDPTVQCRMPPLCNVRHLADTIKQEVKQVLMGQPNGHFCCSPNIDYFITKITKLQLKNRKFMRNDL